MEDEVSYYKKSYDFILYYEQCKIEHPKTLKIFNYVTEVSLEPVNDVLLLKVECPIRENYYQWLIITISEHLKKGQNISKVKKYFHSLTKEESDEFYEVIEKLRNWCYEHHLWVS